MESVTPPAPLGTEAAEGRLGDPAEERPVCVAEVCVSFALAPRPGSVAQARRLMRVRLGEWAVRDDDACDAAALILSELVTNAVVHTASRRIICELCADPEKLRIAVRDEGCGSGVPRPVHRGADEEHGRGLLLVDAVSSAWGVHDAGPGIGRTVWAELRRTAAGAPEFA
ncbi:ATP-binding protein [Streptomyces sp. BG9H]|uniref:ATP-binding protein n=1 Tax=Streptomyces anatolicus TaxID=2675858 RepID=A0ABS6YWF1_9ACTN|nr:ATP-binding protein [Streptomyces anatolicus]